MLSISVTEKFPLGLGLINQIGRSKQCAFTKIKACYQIACVQFFSLPIHVWEPSVFLLMLKGSLKVL